MNPRLCLSVLLVVVAATLPACGSKKRVPPGPPSTSSSAIGTTSSTPTAVTPDTPRSAPAEGDIWSADLDTLNEYLRREGLLGDVYFAYDQSELGPEALDRLDRNARFLQQHPELEVTIEGHCDERGTSDYNLALGERRASAAVSRIQAAGGVGNRLQRISYGKERPVCESPSESCWSRNRRAAFVVTGRNSSS